MARNNFCIIPARGGSKGIPRKNVKDFCGKPLVYWSIVAAFESKKIDRVIVSTEDEEIASISRSFGAEVHERSLENSQDRIHSVNVILECIDYYGAQSMDAVCMLLPTSPLRNSNDINRSVELFESYACDSVVSVKEYNKPISSIRKLAAGYIEPLAEINNFEVQRQDRPEELFEVNGSIYVSSPSTIKAEKSFHRGRVIPYIMSESRSIDINTESEWRLAESVAKGEGK